MIDQNTILLGGSLLGLIILNIILGSVNSFFIKQFDKTKLWQGIFKGIIVSSSFICVCFIGQLNPNILLVSVDGKEINLSNATYLLMMSGYLYYGKEVLVKLSSFISGKFKIDGVVVEDKVEVKEETK